MKKALLGLCSRKAVRRSIPQAVLKALLAAALLHTGLPAATANDSNPADLVKKLMEITKPGAGDPDEYIHRTSEAGDDLGRKFQAAGAPAIPYLLPLLRDKNERVRNLAADILCGMDGLTEKDLDPLIESRRQGNEWIPAAIARIGSPRAVEFLVEELVKEHETGTQVSTSVEWLGEKAIPSLLKVFQNEKAWNHDLETTMYHVLREMGSKAAGAIEPLLSMANDEAVSTRQRIRAIEAIGSMGPNATPAVPRLVRLQKSADADLRDAATASIANIPWPEAAAIVAAKLEQSDPSWRGSIMINLAEFGANAKATGPLVVKYLSDPDWDVRVGAARALGYIGDEDAADDLIRLLHCQEDWRMVWCAAESLRRLKGERALPALLEVADNHWYPPVREAARNAIEVIRGGKGAEPKDFRDSFGEEFLGYEYAGENLDKLKEGDLNLLRFPLAEAEEKDLTRLIKGGEAARPWQRYLGIKVEGGYLAGYDRGEFGGGILFVDPLGKTKEIVNNNTHAIYKTGAAILAVSGLAHLSMNSGLIYKLSKNGDGGWEAKPWRTLPGAPRVSQLLKDGNIFIDCEGGMVLLSPSGEMKALTRDEALRPASTPEAK